MGYKVTIPAAQSGLAVDHEYYLEITQVVLLVEQKNVHVMVSKVDTATYEFGHENYAFDRAGYNYLMSLAGDTTVGSTLSTAIWGHFRTNDLLAEFLLGRPLAGGETLPTFTPA